VTDGCCWAADRDAGPILPAGNRIDPSGRGCQDPAVDLGSSLPAFVLAVLLISVSPGPAMALIFRRAALRGWRGAVPTVLGLEFGLYLWALFAGAGFAALVAASEVAYLVLRIVGAVVLFVLGARALHAAWRGRGSPASAPPEVPAGAPRWWRGYAEGVVVQLANPKAAVFMIAFYPQFVPADGPVFSTTALLGLLQISLETGLYLALAAVVARAGAWFRRPRIRARLEAISGSVLVALGLRVALSGR
jgi:threonine/homoserine/homoserine lactone efflux protein